MPLNRINLKSIYFTLLGLAGRDRSYINEIHNRRLLIVLNLHKISPRSNYYWPSLDPSIFEDLLVFLKDNFNVTLFRDLHKAPDDRASVILSFEDGYYDFIEYAMPLLSKHNVAANLNVIPSCVESGQAPWNVQLYDFLSAAPRRLIDEIKVPGFTERLRGGDRHSKLQFGLSISRFLKNRSYSGREALWGNIADVMSKIEHQKLTRMMSREDVLTASKHHEVGVHSFSHESMGYEDNDFFLKDLRGCTAYFENVLRLPLDIYAFPNGSYRDEQIALLENEGIKHILLVSERFSHRQRNVHTRFTVYGDSLAEAKFLSLGYKDRGALAAGSNRPQENPSQSQETGHNGSQERSMTSTSGDGMIDIASSQTQAKAAVRSSGQLSPFNRLP
jgi:peptidoglycan/xylan/chitin deacetylase (PgdA/CDA1 family)